MIKYIYVSTICLAMLVFSQAANAGRQTGKVIEVRVSSTGTNSRLDPDKPTHFRLSGEWIDKPSCADGQWWAINTDTPAGQNLLRVLLTALESGKTVTAWGKTLILSGGSASCNLDPDMETADQIGIQR